MAWRPAKPLTRKETLYEYALCRQAERGDVQGKRPPSYQIEARARWDAWAQLEGDMSRDFAKRKYVVETQRMMKAHGTRKKK